MAAQAPPATAVSIAPMPRANTGRTERMRGGVAISGRPSPLESRRGLSEHTVSRSTLMWDCRLRASQRAIIVVPRRTGKSHHLGTFRVGHVDIVIVVRACRECDAGTVGRPCGIRRAHDLSVESQSRCFTRVYINEEDRTGGIDEETRAVGRPVEPERALLQVRQLGGFPTVDAKRPHLRQSLRALPCRVDHANEPQ